MARQGRHNEALGLALAASVIGTLSSYVLLLLLIAPVSGVVLKMGPLELFVVSVWGLMLLGSLSGTSLNRGLLAGLFGVLLGTIGMNTAGFVRGTMGVPWLLDGIPTIPAMMGLLAASQLLGMINTKYLIEDEGARKISLSKILSGVKLTLKYPAILVRGTFIGVIVGAIPGVGSSISNLLSYSEAQRTAPDGDTFGKGNPKGVIAAESANSSSEGGAMATMLALGIPGGGATAILLAAFAALVGRHPQARLVLLGDGPEFDALRAAAAPLGSRVLLAGRVDPGGVSAAMARARVVVVPSLRPEGSSLTAAEGARHGRPVVTSDDPAAAEVARQVGGDVVPAGDVAALTARLDHWLADDADAVAVGRRAAHLAAAHYDVNAVTAQIRQTYLDVLDTATG